LEEWGIPVIEVYPYVSKVRLWGKGMPKKTDQLDAIVAAYTAYLYACGLAEGVGDRDEGMIYLPSPSASGGI
jgi:predicted nuclease with RNAse H fold